jgi:hypothetical protein
MQGVGIDLAGERFVPTQHAMLIMSSLDYVEPLALSDLLPDDNSVSAFVSDMEVYADGTGQRMRPAGSC